MGDTKGLLADIGRMDKEALAKVFDLYAPAIYKYTYRHCGNAFMADQVVGDVFVRLLEQLSQGRGPNTNIRSYLFEIAYHAMVDEVRHYHRMGPIGRDELVLPASSYTEADAEEHMSLGIILQAVQNYLTEDQRHVIVLRILEGFSIKETALIMGKKANNIKTIQNRAVTTLRRVLDEQTMGYRSARQA